jgi:ComF family protein
MRSCTNPASGPFSGLRSVLADIERWVLPGACLLCDEPVPEYEGDALVCGICRSRWRAVPEPSCSRCGQPTFADLECRVCAEWPAGLASVRSAVWLEGTARDAVHRLKYGSWPRVAEAMATAMRNLGPLTGGVCLIPVPLGRRRLRERGYNQSERIAEALGALSHLPVRTDLLDRARETPTQTALTPEARQANVARAFQANAARDMHLVLVDDVFTTGATLIAAASALTAGGATRVDAVTFARAMEPGG